MAINFVRPVVINAELVKKEQLTGDVFEFGFKFAPTDTPYKSGQFAMMNFDFDGKKEQRAYSISSPAQIDYFEICVKILPDGKGSSYLNGLKLRDKVEFKLPFGQFTVEPDSPKDILFVGTGTGLAPIKGLVQELLAKGFKQQINLIFGVRSEEDIFYQDILKDLAEKHENFHYRICCSQPSSNWQGDCGRVTAFLSQYDLKSPNVALYICGNGNMVKDVRAYALEQGMERTAVHVENFG